MRVGQLGGVDAQLGGDLRRVAAKYLADENLGHTLQPTALVHEAYARLVQADLAFSDRVHFFAVAAQMMRRVLVDHARKRMARKRGGDVRHVSLDDGTERTAERLVVAIGKRLNRQGIGLETLGLDPGELSVGDDLRVEVVAHDRGTHGGSR